MIKLPDLIDLFGHTQISVIDINTDTVIINDVPAGNIDLNTIQGYQVLSIYPLVKINKNGLRYVVSVITAERIEDASTATN